MCIYAQSVLDETPTCYRSDSRIKQAMKTQIYRYVLGKETNHSHVLFSLFLNVLVQVMSTQGLETISRCTIERLSNDVEVYLRLFVLLYADDTVILAESHVDLQDALNAMLEYCNMWGLLVKTAYTEVTVFL